MSKKSFYCWYLGFTDAYGLKNSSQIYQLVENLIKVKQTNLNKKTNSTPFDLDTTSKVTLCLNDDSLTIIDFLMNKKNKLTREQKKELESKAYRLNYNNITYVARLTYQTMTDVIVFISKADENEGSETKMIPQNAQPKQNTSPSQINLHAFRFDSEESAIKMEGCFNDFRKNYWKKVRKQNEKKQLKSSKSKQTQRVSSPSQTDHLLNSNLVRNNHNSNFILQNKLFVNSNDLSSSGHGSHSSSLYDPNKISPLLFNESSFITPPEYAEQQTSLDMEQKLFSYFNQSSNNQNKDLASHPDNIHKIKKPVKNSQIIDDLNRELNKKFTSGDPILYPPKDYSETQRKRGNLSDANLRHSTNTNVIGKEGLKTRDQTKYNALNERDERDYKRNKMKKVEDDTQSLSSVSSFNEKANEVLKFLDSVVDSGISSSYERMNESNHSINPKASPTSTDVFKFQPPIEDLKGTKSSENYRMSNNQSASLQDLRNISNNQVRSAGVAIVGQGIFQNVPKSSSISSGLNEPYFDTSRQFANGPGLTMSNQVHLGASSSFLIKNNPLHVIEEEVNSNHLVNKNVYQLANENNNRPKAMSSAKINHITNKSNQENLLKPSEIKKQQQQQQQQSSSFAYTAANTGFRNSVFNKLGSYQPQWINNNEPVSHKNNNNKFYSSSFNYPNTNSGITNSNYANQIRYQDQPSARISSFRVSTDQYQSQNDLVAQRMPNNKLKYSESARVGGANMALNNNYNNFQENYASNISALKQALFLRNDTRRLVEQMTQNHYTRDQFANSNLLGSENSEFILRSTSLYSPKSAHYFANNDYKHRDYANNNNENEKYKNRIQVQDSKYGKRGVVIDIKDKSSPSKNSYQQDKEQHFGQRPSFKTQITNPSLLEITNNESYSEFYY